MNSWRRLLLVLVLGWGTAGAARADDDVLARCRGLFHVGDMLAARVACEAALRRDAGLADAHHLAGVAAAATGDVCGARLHYDWVLQHAPTHPAAALLPQALESPVFQACLIPAGDPIAPPEPPWRPSPELVREANAAFRVGNLDTAERLATQAVRQTPDNAGAHKLLAMIYVQRGMSCDAKAHYVAFIRLAPQSPLVPRVHQILAHPDFVVCR